MAIGVLAVIGSALLAVPAAAEDGVAADCAIDAGAAAEIEGELEAAEQAALCGRTVEVTDQRSEFGTVVALPSGELKAQIGVEPIQAQTETGEWAPIDTTLEIAADGSVRPVNITEDVAFSAGGAAPLATVDYGSAGAFALAWPGELPEPVLDGPQAVYAGVLAGVDLVVEATAQGFRYDLVVADAEAAENPALEAIVFDVVASGVEVAATEAGTVEVNVDGQAEMASGEALMWESPASSDGTETVPDLTAITDTPTDPDQEVAPVDVALESADLVLRPDLELLRGADTRYPVVIDPQWDGGIQDNLWGLVNTKYPDSTFYRGKNTSGDYFMSNTGTFGNAGAGQTCDSWSGLDCYSSTYDMRSMFRMDTDTITQNAYRIPNKGVFKIVQRHSASCSNGTARIYRTGGYNSNDTWNTQPSWNESVTISSANNGALCDGSAYVSFNVTSMVQMAEDNEWANLTLGLRAPDESPSPELLEWNRFDSYTAVLEITYDILPYTVKDLKTNGIACTSVVSSAPWMTDRTPEMSAFYSSLDTTVKYQMRVRSSIPTDTIVYEYTSGSVADAARYSRTVPTANQLGDGLYYWLSRAISTSNSSIASSWSAPCRFRVDGTKPSTPTVTPGAEAPYGVGDTLSLTLSSTDPTVNSTSSGVVRFEYSWGTDTYEKKITSTGTASVTAANLTAGRHVLYVRAVDLAGNISNAKTYTFFAGNDIPATPMATWRFEGDTIDDTGAGHDLVLADGTAITYTTDRDGRADAALSLDGSTCLATAESVIRTDAAYSLTAWIRLDAADADTKAIMQVGSDHSAFQIQFDADTDQWFFSVLSEDYTWHSLGAAPTAPVGAWEHIGATYDPDAGMTRLYLGGELVGEQAVSFVPWSAENHFGLGCLVNVSGTTSFHVTGAMDQVGVWQGLLSQAQIQAAMTDLPGARVQADWTFKDDGADTSGYGRNLDTDNVVAGSDPYSRPSGELALDGTSCLEYPEPVASTDRSVTIASWVKFNVSGEEDVIAAISGENNNAMVLRRLATSNRLQFRLTSADAWEDGSATDPTVWDRQTAVETPLVAGEWYHVAGVYDAAAGTMSLYLNGELASSRTVPGMWQATGSTLIGCKHGVSSDTLNGHLDGSLHGLSIWRGAVDATQIASMMGNPPASIASWWALDTEGVDWSGRGQDLTLVDTYSWGDGWEGTPAGAFAVNPIDGGYAYRTGPLVATDESFTIAAYVRADDLAADGVAVSITGDSRSTITLKHSVSLNAWQFAAPPSSSNVNWQSARSTSAPVAGEWTFLAGVFDLAKGELRLYVNGVLAGTATNVVLPASTGRLVIGAEGNADGTTRSTWYGAIDDVLVWQGAVPETVIAQMYNPDLVVNPA